MSILKQLSVSAAGAVLITLGVTATAGATSLTPNADAYVYRPSPDTNYGTANFLQVKNDNLSTGTFDRKSYVRFDLSSVTTPIGSAIFSLTGVSGVGTPPAANQQSTFNIYGLTSTSSNQNWGETSITWNNAPANDTNSDFGVTLEATSLGSFTVSGTGNGTTFSVDNSNLVNFINARLGTTDKLATFIVGRVTPSSTIGDYVHAFNSRESGLGGATLAVQPVPFEFSPGVGVLSLVALGGVTQLQRQVKNRKLLKLVSFTTK